MNNDDELSYEKATALISLAISGEKISELQIEHALEQHPEIGSKLAAGFIANSPPEEIWDVLDQMVQLEEVAEAKEEQRQVALHQKGHNFYEAGNAFNSSLNFTKIMGHITEQALRLVGADPKKNECLSYLALVKGNALEFISSYPPSYIDTLSLCGSIVELSNDSKMLGIAGRAVKTKEPQNVGDVKVDPNYITVMTDIQSQLSIPFLLDDEVIGVLTVEHTRQNHFTSEHIINLQLLAVQASLAINNVQIHEEVKQRLKDLEETAQRIATYVQKVADINQIEAKFFDSALKSNDPQKMFAWLESVLNRRFMGQKSIKTERVNNSTKPDNINDETYSDKNLVCRECGTNFVFTSSEQKYYSDKRWQNNPSRCQECRNTRPRKQQAGDRKGYNMAFGRR